MNMKNVNNEVSINDENLNTNTCHKKWWKHGKWRNFFENLDATDKTWWKPRHWRISQQNIMKTWTLINLTTKGEYWYLSQKMVKTWTLTHLKTTDENLDNPSSAASLSLGSPPCALNVFCFQNCCRSNDLPILNFTNLVVGIAEVTAVVVVVVIVVITKVVVVVIKVCVGGGRMCLIHLTTWDSGHYSLLVPILPFVMEHCPHLTLYNMMTLLLADAGDSPGESISWAQLRLRLTEC